MAGLTSSNFERFIDTILQNGGYNNCLSEIINKVLNMEDEIYYGLIEKLVIYKKKVSKENEKNFIDLCLKQLT